MQKLVMLDGNSLLNRAYFAIRELTNSDGVNVNAVYGFINIMLKVLSEYKPTHFVVAFDKRGKNFRKEIYSEYKANRKGMPDDLANQMPILHELLEAMQVKIVEQAGIEADDLLGTLARRFDTSCLIVSGDRDLLQLVDEKINVVLTKKGITEVELVDVETLKNNYQLTPQQVIEYKALRGDTSDNIPGVKGVGDKTALQLLQQYGDLDNIYQHIEEQKGALKQKLLDDKEMAYISRKLATIVTDVDVDCSLSQCTLPVFDENVKQMFVKLQFRSLLSRLEDKFEQQQPQQQVVNSENVVINGAEQLKQTVSKMCSDNKAVAISLENNQAVFANDSTLQYSVSISDSFLDEINDSTFYSIFKQLLLSDVPKIVFDNKSMRHKLREISLEINNVQYDLALMQYLTEQRSCKTLKELLDNYNYQDIATGMICLKDNLLDELTKQSTLSLYQDIELPLSRLLYDMECEGVKVDIDTLDSMSASFKEQIDSIAKAIHEDAGEPFNVSSPKQLSVILFEKLQLKHFKKTATGYSTNNDVLEKLRGSHPIIEKIILYRQLTKLYGTYIEGLRPLVKKGLVHTTFNQFLTTTGRLSSSDPNLQNIPIRNEQGREIRKLFIPKNGVFVGADYSQIELRLLAGFSKDSNLLDAFRQGQDIHSKVASELMGIPQEMVNSNMRRMAKAVNFGIIYGISDFGLSENVGTSVKKAHEYINLYFQRFPTIKQYLDGCVVSAKENGYVTTLLGRRRYIPEIKSSNYNLRSFGERAAMNMPLQGSAADIMKLAMLRVDKALKQQNLNSKIVLQIHDELIVDTYPDEVEKVKNILVEEMQNAIQFDCPLIVEVEEGATLYDA